MIPDTPLQAFVRESNKIEGILREPTDEELRAHRLFLNQDTVTVEGLEAFVSAVAPGAKLRTKPGMDVRVGNHLPPAGNQGVSIRLDKILREIREDSLTPWKAHLDYENLHPFMDGNGRSGRALWLWMMTRGGKPMPKLLFLHTFYYQTLEESR